jgi:hypothetical protein
MNNTMHLKKMCVKSAICAGILLYGSVASAGPIYVEYGNSNTLVDNVIENGCDPHIEGPANLIQGCLNTNSAFFINFTSNEFIQYDGGGQAQIVATDGSFTFLDISLAAVDWTFAKLVLNIDAEDNGFVNFTGVPGGTSGTFNLDKNGQNYFTITGADFSSVSFTTNVGVTNVGVSDVKQVRIGGIVDQTPPITSDVPTPGTLGLLGVGLLTSGALRNKRRSRT